MQGWISHVILRLYTCMIIILYLLQVKKALDDLGEDLGADVIATLKQVLAYTYAFVLL